MDLATVTKREIAPLFREYGFKGSGAHYRRVREHFIDCINIQRRSDGSSFCVNLGVHPIFALTDATAEKTLREVCCWFRWRLCADGHSDQWWPIQFSSQAEISALKTLFQVSGAQYFDRFRCYPEVFDITPSRIDREREAICKLGVNTMLFSFYAAQANRLMGNFAAARALAVFALSETPERATILRAEIQHFILSLN